MHMTLHSNYLILYKEIKIVYELICHLTNTTKVDQTCHLTCHMFY